MVDKAKMDSEADAFAMALLMPKELLDRDVPTPIPLMGLCLKNLARRYGVTVEHMTARLIQLKKVRV